MKVLVLVPEVHFYAPIVLRELLGSYGDLEYRVLMTPKVRSGGSFFQGLASLIRNQGIRYVASQAALRGLYGSAGRMKSLVGESIAERREIEVGEVINHFGVSGESVESIRSATVQSWVETWEPDFLLSVFFNQIIPESILSAPLRDALNLHPGYLPEYRGSSPVFWQLLNEEERAGCALHRLTSKLDAGPLFDQTVIPVREDESVFSLYSRLARSGAELLVDFFDTVTAGEDYQLEKQNETEANTYSRFEAADVRAFYDKGLTFWNPRDFL